MKFDLNNIKTAVIFGANRGIGLGFVKELLSNYPGIKVIAAVRSVGLDLENLDNKNLEIYQLNPLLENELKVFADHIKIKYQTIDLLINTIGVLHNEKISPEKSLRDLDVDQLLETFKINSLITPLIAKYFSNLFSKESLSVFTTLSAKVGSISDNEMGGWYGYRASKAALNMFIKTIAIEYERKRCKTIFLAIHPGTTITDLSKPFIKNSPYKLHETIESAKNILKVIHHKEYDQSGRFYSWDGSVLEW